MTRLANIPGRKAVKAFVRLGYVHVHTSGDHAILQRPDYPTLSIPLHKEVAPFLLKSQIKRAKLSEKEFLKLLKKKKL
ncbi:MAG: type II toxin-antitoxin system HicA family toxin [Microgenomates group bacterium]